MSRGSSERKKKKGTWIAIQQGLKKGEGGQEMSDREEACAAPTVKAWNSIREK